MLVEVLLVLLVLLVGPLAQDLPDDGQVHGLGLLEPAGQLLDELLFLVYQRPGLLRALLDDLEHLVIDKPLRLL